jgi:hypothetical protein
MSNHEDEKPAPFLTDVDETEEGVEYIKPNIESKLPAKKRQECRNIVQEIRQFGVSQRQLLYLIHILALELENRETMVSITNAIGENREKIPVSGLILPDSD